MSAAIIAGGGIGMCKQASSQNARYDSIVYSKDDTVQGGTVAKESISMDKVASKMLQLRDELKGHEKRAHAIRVMYKQAELGYMAVPTTYGEFEQKVASLVSQDLAVLEKALELSAGDVKLGELSGVSLASQDAAVQFQNQIMDTDA
jgi:hypothetical protein